MAISYSVLGLTLECSHPLPRLAPEPDSHGEPLEVQLGHVPHELLSSLADGWEVFVESTILDDQGRPTLQVWRHLAGNMFRILYADGTEFFIDGAGQRLWVRWNQPYTVEDVTTYLLGPVLGFALRLRGVISIHASAVVIDGMAVALAGAAGAGKSTSAAAFAQRGYAVLSDDIAALRPAGSELLVQADRPLLRLWPASSELLFGSEEALPRLSLTWDKRFLDLEDHGFPSSRTPCPLGAVYLLDGEPIASPRPAAWRLHGCEGLMGLVANSYTTYLLDSQMRAYELDRLGDVMTRLPVSRFHRPQAGLTPAELCDFIADDFRRGRAQRESATDAP